MQALRFVSPANLADAFDSVLTELSYIIGPVLAIGLSTDLFAEAGPLVAVILFVFGVGGFLLQRQTEPEPSGRSQHQGQATLKIPSLQVIMLAFFALGVIGGSIDVVVVAFANAHHWPSAASFILAAYALGSMVAGLVFGTLRLKAPLEQQFLVCVALTAVTILLPALATHVYLMAVAIFIAGLSFAPTFVVVMSLGTQILPREKLTEGLTWLATGINIGVAVGSSLSGRVLDSFGVLAGFTIPILGGLLMLVVGCLGMNTLRLATKDTPQAIKP